VINALSEVDFNNHSVGSYSTLFNFIHYQLFCKLILELHTILNDGKHTLYSFKNKVYRTYCEDHYKPKLGQSFKSIINKELELIVKDLRHGHFAHYTSKTHAGELHPTGFSLEDAEELVGQINKLFDILSFNVEDAYSVSEYYYRDIRKNMFELYEEPFQNLIDELRLT